MIIKKIFLMIIFFIISAFSLKEKYSPDGKFSIDLFTPNISMKDELPWMRERNDALISVFGMGDRSNGNGFVFTISKYQGDTMTIRESFDRFVRPVLPASTILVSADIYKKRNKEFYRKITETQYEERVVRNIMFYFMENDLSDVQYEIKASCSIDLFDMVLENMEKMAGSVRFN